MKKKQDKLPGASGKGGGHVFLSVNKSEGRKEKWKGRGREEGQDKERKKE